MSATVPASAPSFVLADAAGVVTGHGVAGTFGGVAGALAELAADPEAMVVGALPFHAAEPPRLFRPARIRRSGTRAPARGGAWPAALAEEVHPDPAAHAGRVRAALADIGRGRFDKIVLSRTLRARLAAPADPVALLDRFLAASATGDGHLLRLDDSAEPAHLVGSSPELLLGKRGALVVSHPLAGTAPRDPDPAADEAAARGLLASAKNIAEHRWVVDEIARVLRPWCTGLEVPAPALTRTSHTWHLGTRITGTLRDRRTPALALAAALHPTPAVCGHPTEAVRAVLAAEEPDRGFYTGAVGWSDGSGDGRWRVVIRSARLRGREVIAHAGGGIVAGSDPAEEVAETEAKLGPVRAALGLPG